MGSAALKRRSKAYEAATKLDAKSEAKELCINRSASKDTLKVKSSNTDLSWGAGYSGKQIKYSDLHGRALDHQVLQSHVTGSTPKAAGSWRALDHQALQSHIRAPTQMAARSNEKRTFRPLDPETATLGVASNVSSRELKSVSQVEECRVKVRELRKQEGMSAATCVEICRLAELLRLERRLDEAELLHREALLARRRLLDDHHQDTLNSVFCLAQVLSEKDHFHDSLQLHRVAFEGRRATLGGEHPETIQSAMCVAKLLHDNGRIDQAQSLYLEALKVTKFDAAEPGRQLASTGDFSWQVRPLSALVGSRAREAC